MLWKSQYILDKQTRSALYKSLWYYTMYCVSDDSDFYELDACEDTAKEKGLGGEVQQFLL